MTRTPRTHSLPLEARFSSSLGFYLYLAMTMVSQQCWAMRSPTKVRLIPITSSADVSSTSWSREDEFHESAVCTRPRARDPRARCRLFSVTPDVPAPVSQSHQRHYNDRSSIRLPNSRKSESEADFVGLRLMS